MSIHWGVEEARGRSRGGEKVTYVLFVIFYAINKRKKSLVNGTLKSAVFNRRGKQQKAVEIRLPS